MSSTSCWTKSLPEPSRLRLATRALRRVALLLAFVAGPVLGQVDTAAHDPALVLADTTATALVFADTTAAQTTRSVSPGSALWRSLVVPGWGQLYNRDYLKIPVVVGGVGGLGFYAFVLNGRTVRYRRAAIYADCTNAPDTVPPGGCDGFEQFQDEWLEAGSLTALQNRALRDTNRRNRDLMILLGVLAYGLQALDAYVSAELSDFDVSEDLSLHVVPTPHGPAAALRWTF